MKSQTILSVFMGMFIILFMVVATNVGASAYRQDNLAAVISELEGDVQARDSDAGQFASAANGQSLPVGGQVQTGADGRARLDLSSGTIIRVAPSSLFTFQSNEPASGGLSTWLNLELGKVWIILNGGDLNINTPGGVAAVQGSYMNAQVFRFTDGDGKDKLKITVTCFEGNCSVKVKGKAVRMIAGDAADFNYDPATNTVSDPLERNMTEEEIQEWLDLIAEVQGILTDAFATMTAQPTPVDGGGGVYVPPAGGGGGGGGTVPQASLMESGSYAMNPQFSLGTAQVTVADIGAGVVTASIIHRDRFVVLPANNYQILSNGVKLEMTGSGQVQVCFAYAPVKSNLQVVRWDSAPETTALYGRWLGVETFSDGFVTCAKVPAGVFALAGL